MVYDFIHERMARNETGSVGEAKVVPASMTRPAPAYPGSQSTLKPVDLELSWQGSASQGSMPRKEQVPLPRPRAKQPV
jgi:hypothetical protein